MWGNAAPNPIQRQQNWPFVFAVSDGKHESNQTFRREFYCWNQSLVMLQSVFAVHVVYLLKWCSVRGWCCHPLSSNSVICLAPFPPQEHFPSACKMITGWRLDFLLFFSVDPPPPFLLATFFPSSPPVFTFFTVLSPTSLHFHNPTSSFSNSISLSGSCCSLPVLNWCCFPDSG